MGSALLFAVFGDFWGLAAHSAILVADAVLRCSFVDFGHAGVLVTRSLIAATVAIWLFVRGFWP